MARSVQPSEKVRRAAKEILSIIEGGDNEKALSRISAFQGDEPGARYMLARVLVSTGQVRESRAILECGVEAFERLKAKSAPPNDPLLYYDITNGYAELLAMTMRDDHASIFDCEDIARRALRYANRGPTDDPWALTNLGTLYDQVGRPLEGLSAYERALAIDPRFGMAIGNKAVTIGVLSFVTRYPISHLIHAHQLYQQALAHPEPLIEAGGDGPLETFRQHDAAIVQYLTDIGRADRLERDLRHEPYDDSSQSDFAQFYTRFCLRRDLYLNTHLVDRTAHASVGDEIIPPLVTPLGTGGEEARVADVMFRLNEIIESYITARMALVQSQYVCEDFSAISEQTTLVNLLDYSASNIYVGHLKAAYKEAFSALDKIAILLNRYLDLEIPEDRCYYRTVWYEHGADGIPSQPRVVAQTIRDQGARLFGLYLLHHELGGKYADIRNVLTHRYLRVYKAVQGPRGTYLFEELTSTTTEVLYKVKCAIVYVSLFIHAKEQRNRHSAGLAATMPLNTDQHLDLWR
ncbi:MAG: LA2681 family HEPN domain-containing protein [Streptosporangiaceae bacterium]